MFASFFIGVNKQLSYSNFEIEKEEQILTILYAWGQKKFGLKYPKVGHI